MAKKKGKSKDKGKSGKNTASDLPKYPPLVIYKTWPGKIESDQEFIAKANVLRQENASRQENDLVTLRVRQFDWRYHDFMIVVPKSTTILSLKTTIAQNQHLGAILPGDIVLYKKAPVRKMIKTLKSSQQSTSENEKPGIPCEDDFETLAHYFDDILNFKMANPFAQKGSKLNELTEENEKQASKTNAIPKTTPGPFPTGVPQFFRYVPQSEDVKSNPIESIGIGKPRKTLFMAPTLGARRQIQTPNDNTTPSSNTNHSNNTDDSPFPCVSLYYDLGCYSLPSDLLNQGIPQTNARLQNPLLMRFNLPNEENKQDKMERRKSNAASTGFGLSVQLLLTAKRMAKKVKTISNTKRRSIFLSSK